MNDDRVSYRISPTSGPEQPPHVFPEAGDYAVYSSVTFFVQRGGAGELVDCDSRMFISLSDARLSEEGQRVVEMNVMEWEAYGQSELLGGEIGFRLVENLDSRVTAGSPAADLPGKMYVSGMLETFFNGTKVDESFGEAEGLISRFPPAPGDLFDVTGKRVEVGDIVVQGMHCKCNK